MYHFEVQVLVTEEVESFVHPVLKIKMLQKYHKCFKSFCTSDGEARVFKTKDKAKAFAKEYYRAHRFEADVVTKVVRNVNGTILPCK